MLSRLFYTVSLFALCLLSSSCVHKSLINDRAFERTGSFYIVEKENSKTLRAFQGNFFWNDYDEYYEMGLSNFFGKRELYLKVSSENALLRTADGFYLQSLDVDSLVSQFLGYKIPMNSLRLWLKGYFAFNDVPEKLSKDKFNKTNFFVVSEWEVTLSSYDVFGPRKIILQRKQENSSITIKLIVKN
ncbi:outer membrane lipoprotein LolB [Candidatus Kinetoplastibacterium oncopeltii TCC290E]|uniref:Outer-membrane lipoprotein LolB n=1 Tax=Candidatus Kinetoplastidibacterium stringomonadis TCC290E TaxID=1208920 RepID=M1LVK6_9PROT|nr:outer membrane lipoprotein LolB [Candidatus Kinetoplastibacterium oncopeltii]AGF48121.1 outer membrane lipoprotein LolB [Candidatus Kinetoplastibacterium oncopeltii TCC290E]